jgi:hypothetical protein
VFSHKIKQWCTYYKRAIQKILKKHILILCITSMEVLLNQVIWDTTCLQLSETNHTWFNSFSTLKWKKLQFLNYSLWNHSTTIIHLDKAVKPLQFNRHASWRTFMIHPTCNGCYFVQGLEHSLSHVLQITAGGHLTLWREHWRRCQRFFFHIRVQKHPIQSNVHCYTASTYCRISRTETYRYSHDTCSMLQYVYTTEHSI